MTFPLVHLEYTLKYVLNMPTQDVALQKAGVVGLVGCLVECLVCYPKPDLRRGRYGHSGQPEPSSD